MAMNHPAPFLTGDSSTWKPPDHAPPKALPRASMTSIPLPSPRTSSPICGRWRRAREWPRGAGGHLSCRGGGREQGSGHRVRRRTRRRGSRPAREGGRGGRQQSGHGRRGPGPVPALSCGQGQRLRVALRGRRTGSPRQSWRPDQLVLQTAAPVSAAARWNVSSYSAGGVTRPGFVRAAPALSGTTRTRLPSASPPCCDRISGEGLPPPLESTAPHGANRSTQTRLLDILGVDPTRPR